MKKTILIFTFTMLVGFIIYPNRLNGQTMSVYLTPETETLLGPNVGILYNKMETAISASGLFSSSDSRFVIVPKVDLIEETTTTTIPVQYIVEINITYCVGDGLDGKLVNSLNKTYRGVGENRIDALKVALLKINPTTSDLKQLLITMNDRIILFYDETGSQTLQKARNCASSENYESAIKYLNLIPQNCKYNDIARKLEQEYIEKIISRNNRHWLNKAKSSWSSSQNLFGASEAKKYLDKVIVRNEYEQDDVNMIISEINKGIFEYNKNQSELQLRQIDNDAAINIAKIEARANIISSIANTAASIIPNIFSW